MCFIQDFKILLSPGLIPFPIFLSTAFSIMEDFLSKDVVALRLGMLETALIVFGGSRVLGGSYLMIF